MNKARRKEIESIVTELQALNERISTVLDEEQTYFDNMPEGVQSGSKGDAAQEAISNLESASLDDVISSLESSIES